MMQVTNGDGEAMSAFLGSLGGQNTDYLRAPKKMEIEQLRKQGVDNKVTNNPMMPPRYEGNVQQGQADPRAIEMLMKQYFG